MKELERLQNNIANLYSVDNEKVFLLENARSAFYLYLKSLNLPKGTEVAIQGFTCAAIVGPILWLGLKPLYIDIKSENDLTMSPADLKNKISKKTKVVIVQHTFSMFADMKKINKIANQANLTVIEDLAHVLGVNSKKIGKSAHSDALIISFGLNKMIPTQVGGALVVKGPNIEEMRSEYSLLDDISKRDELMWLNNKYPWKVIKYTKVLKTQILKLFVKLNVINMGFFENEIEGVKPSRYPRRLTAKLADNINFHLRNIKEIASKRTEAAEQYDKFFGGNKNLISPIRYPVLLKNSSDRNKIFSVLKNSKVRVGDWYWQPIYPNSIDLKKFGYLRADCPVAESVCEKIINLPTDTTVNTKLLENIKLLT